MIVKSSDWANFKSTMLHFASVFEIECAKLMFDSDNPYDFGLWVNECRVNPVFTKKADFHKVEYDFTNCDTELRTLSFSRYKDAARMEITLKKKKENA